MLFYEMETILKELNEIVVILSEENEVTMIEDPQRLLNLNLNDYFQHFTINNNDILTVNGNHFICKKTSYHHNNQKMTILTLNSINGEELLHKKVKIYEQIIDELNDGIMATDEDGKIFIYNKAQEKLENMNREDVIGKYLWEVYRIDPKNSEHRHVFFTKKPIIGRYQAHAYPNNIPQYTTYSTRPLIYLDESVGAFSVCTNDTKLKDLLHETIELKRQLQVSHWSEKYTDKYKNGTSFSFDDLVGSSTDLKKVIQQAQNISLYNMDVLIVGETGTGKELFAQGIHNHSPRAREPFVAVNCAAIPETLLENTLFGSVKGAFTGATNQTGLFESAKGGTLFLDEINSLSLTLQSKLIRVLEERKIRKVGSNELIPIKCNIITASNEDPEKLIQENRLRLDLYYRIAKVSLAIPPLRQRKEDILFLTQYFIQQFNKKYGKDIQCVSDEVKEILIQYPWPGNVRELEHLIESMFIQTAPCESVITEKSLPYLLKEFINKQQTPQYTTNKSPQFLKNKLSKEDIQQALQMKQFNITQAAELLNISRQNLQYYLKNII